MIPALYVSLPPNKNIVVQIQNKYAALIDSGTITIISPRDTSPIIIPDSTIVLNAVCIAYC